MPLPSLQGPLPRLTSGGDRGAQLQQPPARLRVVEGGSPSAPSPTPSVFELPAHGRGLRKCAADKGGSAGYNSRQPNTDQGGGVTLRL